MKKLMKHINFEFMIYINVCISMIIDFYEINKIILKQFLI